MVELAHSRKAVHQRWRTRGRLCTRGWGNDARSLFQASHREIAANGEKNEKDRMNGRRGNDECFGENGEGKGEGEAQVKRERRRSRSQSEGMKKKTLARVREREIEKMNA